MDKFTVISTEEYARLIDIATRVEIFEQAFITSKFGVMRDDTALIFGFDVSSDNEKEDE